MTGSDFMWLVQNVRGVASVTNQDKHSCFILEEYDYLQDMRSICVVMNKLRSSKGQCFSLHKREDGACYVKASELGESVMSAVALNCHGLRVAFPLHKFNPVIELFMGVVDEMSASDLIYAWRHEFGSTERLAYLNSFVGKLRDGLRTDAFKKYCSKHARAMNKNSQSLREYIESILKCHARILVVRVDFGYEKEYGALAAPQSRVEHPEVKLHRERLIRCMQKKLCKDSLIGHAWKLEYGVSKGFHYHMLFFFDGSKVREDVTLGRIVGEYWKEYVTNGKGVYFNCNARKHEYDVCGLGRVDHHDETKRNALLEYVASYLVKPDYLAQLMIPEGGRVFGKGVMPTSSGLGRPRGAMVPQHS